MGVLKHCWPPKTGLKDLRHGFKGHKVPCIRGTMTVIEDSWNLRFSYTSSEYSVLAATVHIGFIPIVMSCSSQKFPFIIASEFDRFFLSSQIVGDLSKPWKIGMLLFDCTDKVFQNAGTNWTERLLCDASQTDRVDMLDWKVVIKCCIFTYLHSGEMICNAILNALFVFDF